MAGAGSDVPVGEAEAFRRPNPPPPPPVRGALVGAYAVSALAPLALINGACLFFFSEMLALFLQSLLRAQRRVLEEER